MAENKTNKETTKAKESATSLTIANPYTKEAILTEKDLELLLALYRDKIEVPTGDVIQKTEEFSLGYYWAPAFTTYSFEEQKVYIRELYAKLADIQVRAAQATDLSKSEAKNLLNLGKAYKDRLMKAFEKLRADYKIAEDRSVEAITNKLFTKAHDEAKKLNQEEREKRLKEDQAFEAEWNKEERKALFKFVAFVGICAAILLIPFWLHLGGVI